MKEYKLFDDIEDTKKENKLSKLTIFLIVTFGVFLGAILAHYSITYKIFETLLK